MRLCLVYFVFALTAFTTCAYAQESVDVVPVAQDDDSVQITRLDELARLLASKTAQRDELKLQLNGVSEDSMVQERTTLKNLNRDIGRLATTFEVIALGNTDISLLNPADDVETDWRQDLIDILDPLIESLKSVTERPRQLAELRETIYLSQSKLDVAESALGELQDISLEALDDTATARVAELIAKWTGEIGQLQQELLLSNSQLERLTADQKSFFEGVWPATQTFLLGRGLTLIIAIVIAAIAWGMMRVLWWFYTTRFTTRELRRNKTWFRLLEYSYYFVTILVTLLAVLIVLYIREDLLLIALSLLLIFGAVLSFRQFLPRYIREARLLLNLGSVREDERVIYNGLPWQVMSLNLHSVLRNPALDGVIRLPLDRVSDLVSRPVKNNLWFPSNRGDYVILPDGVLGKVKHQTPDLVEISIRGGMTMTYNTSDFYSINLINLSRDETFGVSVTFGLDYELQAISLTEIPVALEAEVHAVLADAGYKKHLKSLLVELSSANASSLDFILFATLDSKVASDFYGLQRLILQSCVAVSNKKGWNIPFPQLTIHQSPAATAVNSD